jgi:hypothetical protein
LLANGREGDQHGRRELREEILGGVVRLWEPYPQKAPPRLHLLPLQLQAKANLQSKVSPPLYSFSLNIMQQQGGWLSMKLSSICSNTPLCTVWCFHACIFYFGLEFFFCKSAYGDLLVNFALFCVVAWLGYVHLGR